MKGQDGPDGGEPTVRASATVGGLGGTGDADPSLLVLFGASGDLARRELFPALHVLHRHDLLPDPFAVVGSARADWDTGEFRERVREAVPEERVEGGGDWDEFAARLHYQPADVQAPPDEDFAELAGEIERVRDEHDIPDNLLFHLALPPDLFTEIPPRLDEAGLLGGDGWRRLLVEKPFGRDRESAARLDRELHEFFPEERIYRVDHFMAMETVQNMMVSRFANPEFEPIWNREHIDHVQITVAEEVGVGGRGGFYEETGVLRDMVQNHLLHLLCVTALEPPLRCRGDALRNETVRVLDAIEPPDPERDFVGGQYGPGRVDGSPVEGYREEDGVADDSTTPTFAALELELDNWRWAGVPFYLRTGKRMARPLSEIAVHFRPTPHAMLPGQGEHRSVLAFRLRPREGIIQRFAAKRPGPGLELEPVRMEFGYAETFGVEELPPAYAWLLLDAMEGDRTLFARRDWVDRAWSLVDPLVEHWEEDPPGGLPDYRAGSRGPDAARRLVERSGREWTEL